jgi:hypothetical protein
MLKPILISAALVIPWSAITAATHAAPIGVAAEEKEGNTHEGKVVSVAEGKLVMTDNDGKNEHSHKITSSTKITLDGKTAKLADLKKDDSIKVTMVESNVTMVAATRKAAAPK